MNDNKLLELAAKAAGYKIVAWIKDCDGVEVPLCQLLSGGAAIAWMPLIENALTDCDGDALRLAVKLKLNIINEYSPKYAYAENDSYECLEDENGCCTKSSECNNDPYAAIRRAIVRAAAEIGKDMP